MDAELMELRGLPSTYLGGIDLKRAYEYKYSASHLFVLCQN
jgi:hypothetical protein